jgi:hypothetical protein
VGEKFHILYFLTITDFIITYLKVSRLYQVFSGRSASLATLAMPSWLLLVYAVVVLPRLLVVTVSVTAVVMVAAELMISYLFQ